MVWWLSARLIEERERACDEAVLESGSDPQAYAESILKTCQFCVESPLTCVPGVMSANLKKRLVRIMTQPRAFHLGLSKKLLLSAASVAVIAGPVLLGRAIALQGHDWPKAMAILARPPINLDTSPPMSDPSHAGPVQSLQVPQASGIHVRPFVMEQVDFVVQEGKEQITSRYIASRRRDRAYSRLATAYYSPPPGSREVTNTVRFLGGLTVWTYLEIRVRSTTVESGNQVPDYMTMTMLSSPPDRCFEEGQTLDGEEYMLGRRTARVITYYADPLTRWVDWKLLDFNWWKAR